MAACARLDAKERQGHIIGANSKHRREAKELAKGGSSPARVATAIATPAQEMTVNRALRQECPECGSPDLSWAFVGDAAKVPGEQGDWTRVVQASVGPNGEVWHCGACGKTARWDRRRRSSSGRLRRIRSADGRRT